MYILKVPDTTMTLTVLQEEVGDGRITCSCRGRMHTVRILVFTLAKYVKQSRRPVDSIILVRHLFSRIAAFQTLHGSVAHCRLQGRSGLALLPLALPQSWIPHSLMLLDLRSTWTYPSVFL